MFARSMAYNCRHCGLDPQSHTLRRHGTATPPYPFRGTRRSELCSPVVWPTIAVIAGLTRNLAPYDGMVAALTPLYPFRGTRRGELRSPAP